MSEFKGTPGPLEPKFISGVCMGVGTPGDYCFMTCNTILPDTDAEYEDEEEVIKANMQLYASAPELLEALINLIDVCEAYAHYNQWLHIAKGVRDKALGKEIENV